MAECAWCKNEMTSGTSCTVDAVHHMGRRYDLPRYGGRRRPCGDCGVQRGGLHHPGCDLQRCPRCRGQLIMCGCGFDEQAIDLTVPPGAVCSFDGPAVPFGVDANGYPVARATMDGDPVILHYVDVPESDVSMVDGIRVTTPLRTIIDLAAEVDDAILRRMVTDAVAREMFTLDQARSRVDEPDLSGHRGAATFREFLRTFA